MSAIKSTEGYNRITASFYLVCSESSWHEAISHIRIGPKVYKHTLFQIVLPLPNFNSRTSVCSQVPHNFYKLFLQNSVQFRGIWMASVESKWTPFSSNFMFGNAKWSYELKSEARYTLFANNEETPTKQRNAYKT